MTLSYSDILRNFNMIYRNDSQTVCKESVYY